MPDEYGLAALINGLPTVTFVSRPFQRVIRTVWMEAAINASVQIFKGSLQSPGIITSNLIAHPATYSVPFILPKGYVLYVVFSAAATPVNAAQAKISAYRIAP